MYDLMQDKVDLSGVRTKSTPQGSLNLAFDMQEIQEVKPEVQPHHFNTVVNL